MSGYARIHRSLLGHPVFRNDAEAMAFAWMIVRASWKPARVRYKGRAIALSRGQLAISIRDMADAMDRDKAWIERLFKRLRAETMIETVVEAGVSIVTICNYEKYQAEFESCETVSETVGEIDARQRRDTEQRREKQKNIPSEGKPSSGKRAHASKPQEPIELPEWIPVEAWAAYTDMRKQKGWPTTAYVASKLIERLDKWRGGGWSTAAILDKATVNCWRDIYEPTHGRDDDMRTVPTGLPGTPNATADQRRATVYTRAQRQNDSETSAIVWFVDGNLNVVTRSMTVAERSHWIETGKRPETPVVPEHGTRHHYYDRPSGWAPLPGMEGVEPVSLDDDELDMEFFK